MNCCRSRRHWASTTHPVCERTWRWPAMPSSGLAMSQSRTRTGIIAVGIAMVAIGLGFSWLIGRRITRPLNGLVTVMKRLANGDTTTRIPATHAHDEIGEMARDNRAVQEFSGNCLG